MLRRDDEALTGSIEGDVLDDGGGVKRIPVGGDDSTGFHGCNGSAIVREFDQLNVAVTTPVAMVRPSELMATAPV